MRNFFYLLLLLPLFIVSCKKESSKVDLKADIIGTWKFDDINVNFNIGSRDVDLVAIKPLIIPYLPFKSIIKYLDDNSVETYESANDDLPYAIGTYSIINDKVTYTFEGSSMTFNGSIINKILYMSLDKNAVIELISKSELNDDDIAGMGIPGVNNKQTLIFVLSGAQSIDFKISLKRL